MGPSKPVSQELLMRWAALGVLLNSIFSFLWILRGKSFHLASSCVTTELQSCFSLPSGMQTLNNAIYLTIILTKVLARWGCHMHNYIKRKVGHDLLSTYYAPVLPFPPSLTCFFIPWRYLLPSSIFHNIPNVLICY